MRFEVIALHWGVVCSFLDGIRAPLGTVSKDPSRQVNSLALFFVVPFILKGQDEEKQDGYSDNQKLLGVSRAYSSAPYIWKSRPRFEKSLRYPQPGRHRF